MMVYLCFIGSLSIITAQEKWKEKLHVSVFGAFTQMIGDNKRQADSAFGLPNGSSA